ncbi:MAG: geranylgeranyl reductase family protein [Methanosarcina sp.]|jgi:digeranylgeranylglycerophospholipid reductase|nr:geranylgeranyl reductase family protein [Methanosarcina sp.]MDD3316110.1 geranylgeranyl reductase family protein [Methanosarcina sp.]MDD4306643.1 geranylgeranyl reductase family protein [Methanosarcina sp.]MDD4619460.1 geranylgeranyl reductase family protein [Methanosarcina sp.]
MIPEASYDVIVVGAGPAGSTSALYAAKNGASVLLLDKKREIGSHIQCAGFLPDASEVQALLRDARLPDTLKNYPDSCVLQRIDTQRLITPNCNIKEFAVRGTVLDRRRYDQFLAEQAARAGAELMIKTRVTKIEGTTIETSGIFGKHKIKAKAIIGADGPNSLVAKSKGLALKSESRETSVALEYQVRDVDIDPSALEMYFGKDFVPGGYAWIFPEGKDRANVGIGIRSGMAQKGISAKEYLHRFMRDHPLAGPKLKNSIIMNVIAGIIPVNGAPERTATENALVVGDAAGQIFATNGGGIPPAMIAGKIAGETAAEFAAGKCKLEEYDRRWRAQFGSALETSVQARQLMDGIMKSDTLMNAAFKLISPEQMKVMQCGKLPGPVRLGLQALNRGKK